MLNLTSYIMVHGGADRHERLLDVDWARAVIDLAREVCFTNLDPEKQDKAIDEMRKALRRWMPRA